MSVWQEVSSKIPQRSVLAPIMISIFINNLDVGMKSILLIFADNIKLVRVANNLEDRIKILDKRLDKWEN